MLRVHLLTQGSPASVTGGHLYHRRMAEAAPAHDAKITFAQTPSSAKVDRAMPTSWSSTASLRGASLRRSSCAGSCGRSSRWCTSNPAASTRRRRGTGCSRRPIGSCTAAATSCSTASRSLADALVAEHGVDAERVRLVEPGCDLPPVARRPDLRGGRRVALVCVSNWYPNKGLLELLDAVAALPAGDATLHLAGRDDVDADYGDRVRRRLIDPDLAERVVAHGAVDRQTVAELYAGADVFVLPSYVEGYATVVAEALCAGLPVVGWRRPHFERLATDGVEGCLLEPGDVPALSDALSRLATDDDHRLRLAAAARRRGSTLPTWDDTAARFFSALRAAAAAVEPADDRSGRLDVDAADAGVLDERSPGDLVGHPERPGQRRLDRADVGDDHDD